jgi:hypothetical protein
VHSKIQLIEDIKFIFVECERLWDQIQSQGLLSISKEDSFCEMPHPSHNSAKMLCGHAASQRLNKISRNVAIQHGLEKRIKLEKFREIFSRIMVNRFLREKRPINTKEVDKIIGSSVKQAKTHLRDVTYFIPCHLMRTKDPEALVIGPIKFHNRASIRRLFLDKLNQRIEDPNTEHNKNSRRLLNDAIRYYRKFGWVAEVEIKGYDRETSAEIAEQAVISALDCLHLMLGAEWTDKMQIQGPAIFMDRRAKLYLSDSNELEASLSSSVFGQVNFTEGWSEGLSSPEHINMLNLFGVALELAVDPALARPLSQRFLDAAQWFGEASRDKSPSTRVVKYVTALERMVMTEEQDDISRLVSDRVSAFCFDKPEDRELWRAKVKKTYDLRSKLVHGSISPRSDEVWQGVYVGAQLCEVTLLRVLNEFGVDGLKEDKFSSRRLGEWFNNVTNWADRQLTKIEE